MESVFLSLFFIQSEGCPRDIDFLSSKWICNILEMKFLNYKKKSLLENHWETVLFCWTALCMKNYLNSIPFCATWTFMPLRMWCSRARSPHCLWEMSSAFGKAAHSHSGFGWRKKQIRFHSTLLVDLLSSALWPFWNLTWELSRFQEQSYSLL